MTSYEPDAALPDRVAPPFPAGVPATCPACGRVARGDARFCDGCGAALERAAVGATAAEAATDAAALQRVLRAVVGSLELGPMLREVARACLGVAGAEGCAIERWHRDSDETETLAEESVPDWPEGNLRPGTRTPLDGWDSYRAALAGVVWRRGSDEALTPRERAAFAEWRVATVLLVPIAARGTTLGLLELYSRREDAFPPDRIALCREIATVAGLGIQQADAFERERRLATRLQTVARATTAAVRQLDPERLLADVPSLIVATYGHYLVNVFLRDPADGALVLRSSAGYPGEAPLGERTPPGVGICSHVAATGQPYVAPDVRVDPLYVPGPLLSDTRAELAAPIAGRGGRVIGVLDVQSRGVGAFDEADAVALRALAAAVGAALENADLFRRVREDDLRLRAIMEAVPSPLGVYDAGWRLQFANRAMFDLYGADDGTAPPFPAAEGLPFAQIAELLADRLDNPEALLGLARGVAGGEGGEAARRADGDGDGEELRFSDPARTFVRRVTPVGGENGGDGEGAPAAHVVLYQDVTAERAALRAKDQLLSIAAHELRTPLTAMLGFVELLKAQVDRSEPNLTTVRQRVATVHREGRRLGRLVQELLELAQLEAGRVPLRPAEVGLGDLFARLAERFEAVPGASARLEIAGPAELVCRWDEGRVEQILANLVDNALKYGRPETAVLVVAAVPTPETVRIEVRDEGPGLAPGELARLFRPFARVGAGAEVGGGLGLGLYVSRLLTERQGGQLWLESAPDRGVTAVLELPVAGEAAG